MEQKVYKVYFFIQILEFKNYLIENKGMGMVLLFDDCEDLFES